MMSEIDHIRGVDTYSKKGKIAMEIHPDLVAMGGLCPIAMLGHKYGRTAKVNAAQRIRKTLEGDMKVRSLHAKNTTRAATIVTALSGGE